MVPYLEAGRGTGGPSLASIMGMGASNEGLHLEQGRAGCTMVGLVSYLGAGEAQANQSQILHQSSERGHFVKISSWSRAELGAQQCLW